jgi:hypothetical protein
LASAEKSRYAMRIHIIAHRASLDVVEIVDYLSDREMAAGEQFLQQS